MEYNYVFFQVPHDYYSISMSETLSMSNVKYCNYYPYFGGKLMQLLHRIHFSGKINSIISLPFKNIWNKFYFNNTFSDDKPICFIFSGATAIWSKSGLTNYLKSKYAGAKFVCFYQDIIASYKDFTINQAKSYFDLVISYDKVDAEKYGILYHPTQYTKIIIPQNDLLSESDIYFVGAAKNRLGTIIKAYEYFKKIGLKCDFNITDVALKDRKYVNEINYINRMSYIENLQHIEKAKGILEIMQEGAVGFTLRMWEAITYNKLLITDNKAIEKLQDNSNGFVMLNETGNDWKELLSRQIIYAPQWQDDMSVKGFIQFVQNNL